MYTILGGMRAVAYTSAIQTVILVIGSALITIYGLMALGGWGQLRAIAGSEMFNLWRPSVPDGMAATWAPVKEAGRMAWYFNSNYPWVGMLFCTPIIGLWYWCTDQYIVQRVLASQNETDARRDHARFGPCSAPAPGHSAGSVFERGSRIPLFMAPYSEMPTG